MDDDDTPVTEVFAGCAGQPSGGSAASSSAAPSGSAACSSNTPAVQVKKERGGFKRPLAPVGNVIIDLDGDGSDDDVVAKRAKVH